MSAIEIIGAPMSTYVRAVRIACEEKGVAYSITAVRPHSPEIEAVHPFGKLPAMRHDGFELYESSAIARYLDAAFPGPKLFPADPKIGALTEQFVSLVNTHLDPTLVRKYLLAYAFPKTPDKSPDRAAIAAVLPDVLTQIALLDRSVSATGFLAGDGFTYADANLLPILAYLSNLPESGAAIAEAAHLSAYFAAMSARPSFQATIPPPRR